MDRIFTVDEVRALLPAILTETDELIAARADLAEIAFDRENAGSSPLGGLAEIKGIEVKGIAPVLLDFPALLDEVSVRLCWIEGETELGWYHRTDLGFPGRRPLMGPL